MTELAGLSEDLLESYGDSWGFADEGGDEDHQIQSTSQQGSEEFISKKCWHEIIISLWKNIGKFVDFFHAFAHLGRSIILEKCSRGE